MKYLIVWKAVEKETGKFVDGSQIIDNENRSKATLQFLREFDYNHFKDVEIQTQRRIQ